MSVNPSITVSPFGTTESGKQAQLFTLTNANGMRVSISDFGGVITECWTPDKAGTLTDVVLGFDDVAPYETQSPYFGALIGRFGNRIAKGKFQIDDKNYELATNDGENHLHGGNVGFDKVLWSAETSTQGDDLVLTLSYTSVDGEEGYPGNLDVTVVYRLTSNNELFTEFTATTDATTPVNLTQHSYFNLTGNADILHHRLKLYAKGITPIRKGLIPIGEVQNIANTPFDFTDFRAIGDLIDSDDEQLALAGGYDHNFVLNSDSGNLAVAAEVEDPISGRRLTVKTTEPAIQFYSGNFLDDSLSGKGRHYPYRGGFCLEPQHYPDAPNQSHFPNTLLHPGETYSSKMCFAFSTINEE